jgi:hypothetical protein
MAQVMSPASGRSGPGSQHHEEATVMEHGGTPPRTTLGFDWRTESWYVELPPGEPLRLDRPTLRHLVELYNRIHHGDPLYLLDHRHLRQIQDQQLRLTRTVRDLYAFMERHKANPRARRLRRIWDRLRGFGRRRWP